MPIYLGIVYAQCDRQKGHYTSKTDFLKISFSDRWQLTVGRRVVDSTAMKSSPVVAPAGGGGHSQQNGGPAGGGVDSHNSHPPRQQQHRPDPQHQQQQQSAATAASLLQKSDPANKTGGSGGMSGPCYEKPQGVQHTLQVPPTAAPRRSMSGQAGPPSAAQRGAAGAASRRTRFALQVRRNFYISFHIWKIIKIRTENTFYVLFTYISAECRTGVHHGMLCVAARKHSVNCCQCTSTGYFYCTVQYIFVD